MVLGSFDPFSEIAAIARKFGVRFHIDASWGGPFVFLHSLKHKLHATRARE
jgi:glutamate decarboxylase